ncbi:MAG: flap endonuclease-1 [Candidatus Micrarchaeota archaeon]|nr:flap endonuclease-1 [Candidatus Micrarchaeota archaeon]
MGVDLGEIPKKPCRIQELSGKRFAVDAYNAIYQFISSIRQPDGTPLKDAKGRTTGHLAGIFYRNCRLLENGIRPVYVFDGEPPELKSGVLGERWKRRLEAEKEWKAALEKGDIDAARRAAQASSRLTPEMAEESKKLLELMGIQVVQAPSEGEAQASQMAIEGSVDAVASQDMDCLLFGAPALLRNLSVGGRRKMPGKSEYVEVEPEFIYLSSALETLQLTREQLLWMGILIGTDFNEGVKGIGPKKAHKIAKESASLEQAAEKAGAKEMVEEFKLVEAFFLHPPVKPKVAITDGKMDREGIARFLCDEHDFSYERVSRTIDSVEKRMKEIGDQTSLSRWC